MFGSLRIVSRLNLILTLFIVFLVSLIATNLYSQYVVKDRLERIVNRNNTRERLGFDINYAVNSKKGLMRSVIIRDLETNKKKDIALYENFLGKHDEAFTKLVEMSPEPEAKAILKRIDDLTSQVRPLNEKVFAHALANEDDLAAEVLFRESATVMDKMLEEIDLLIDFQRKLTQQRYDESMEVFALATNLIYTISAVAIGSSFILFFLIARSITGPLNLGVSRVRDIAEGEGDLTKRLDIKTKDELGELGGWIDQFILKIHDNVQKIDTYSKELKQSSDGLKEVSQNVSSGNEEMSSQSQMIASSATQMNQNLQVVSSSMEEMSISVEEVAKKASDASTIVREADLTVKETETIVKTLGESAKEIGKVIDSITEIAAQTNLLALNAAIEAAGAGESGKGFAVVASEVKALARQVAVSSEEIKEKITAIQKNTDKTISAITNISDVIEKVTEISTSIASSVEEQSITAKEIASNVNQTSVASNDVTKNITSINTVSKDGAKQASVAYGMTQDLQKLAVSLSEIVGQFKIQKSQEKVKS